MRLPTICISGQSWTIYLLGHGRLANTGYVSILPVDQGIEHSAGASFAIAVENEVADNMYQRSELDYLIYNDPIGYADLVLNGNPEIYLKTVTECKPLD